MKKYPTLGGVAQDGHLDIHTAPEPVPSLKGLVAEGAARTSGRDPVRFLSQ